MIAGQGTAGLEITEQAKDLGIDEADLLVCCGGGGLTSGIALACAENAKNFKVHPVEPAGFDDVARSLISGKEKQMTTTPAACAMRLLPLLQVFLHFPF